MLHRIGTALFVLLALACAGPEAWAAKVGPEFRGNTYTANDQSLPSVAPLSNGGFVVTWNSFGQDGSGYGIYGQRYSGAGARVGAEFRVNTYTTNYQDAPSAAGLSGGGFVVTWNSFGQDGSLRGVYGQRYSAAGVRVGAEFRVNTYTTNYQDSPSIAGLSNGSFVVTWNSFGKDGSGYGVYGQRYSAAGARVGGEFRVNSYTAGFQWFPSVAGLSNGGFVATWRSSQDGDLYGIYGQRYSAAGARVGAEFQVNTTTVGDQAAASAAPLSNGGFVVTWLSVGQDGSGSGVYGQRYSAAGARVGGEFRVNTYTTNEQRDPSAAGLSNGGFVVTWNSFGKDSSGYGVYGQRYSAAGARVGGEFRANTYTTNNQWFPSVAGLSGGGFVVTWNSTLQDGSGEGVYGQRYGP